MKKTFLILSILLLFVNLTIAQEMPANVDEVINWSFKVDYTSENEATIIITANQKDGWHVYAQKQPEGSVSMPTSFEFVSNSNYKTVGKTKEYGTTLHDGQFPERIFEGKKAIFKQKIKILSKKDFDLTVKYSFMACLEACFPPTDRQKVLKIKGAKEKVETSINNDATIENKPNENIETILKVNYETLGIDSSLAMLTGTCEGFEYVDDFKPVSVKVNTPLKKNANTYELSVEITVDSIFKMYDFENDKKYKSLFNLSNTKNIEFVGKPNYSFKSLNGLYSKPDTTEFVLVYTQNIQIKDTAHIDTLYGFMDIYLQGCNETFQNKEPFNLVFDLLNPIHLDQDEDNSSLWLVFILAFASGFIALLTPCVFPMIPMTVSFFTKQSKTKSEGIRKALLFVIFIIVIYVMLGVVISAIFGADALNMMATNKWVNLSFALLFIIFAISFLGAFEIALPASWVNKADKQADRGGIIGIFFMAFTLALVSFSCTGPIVGSVLVKSAEGGEVLAPIIAMLGFSSALALPFGLFAAFPGWLNSLPQSGGWLNTVKVTLGLLEIAFAMKFLLQADQGFETYMFTRELFLAIWVGVFLLLAIYLLGFIQFPHDSKVEKLSVGRGLMGLLSLSFAFYLIPGLWGAPVNIISGIAPSKSQAESPYGVNVEAPKKGADMPESAEYHGHGIWVIHDYDDAMAYAKEQDKPLLIDFTGIQCVNCRKMEDFVWANEEVAPIMADKFVIASLYVDDKAKLPKNEWITLSNGTVIKEVGQKWFNFQTSRYAQGTQPLYVVVDYDENNISGKASYDTHNTPEAFKKWLNNALKQFENSQNPNLSNPDFKIVK